MKVDKVVITDVLVIGGAGAGVMSAVTAKQQGADVCIISKGKIGKSGNTIMIGGGFGIDGKSAYEVCNEKDANTSYTKEDVYNSVVESGFYLADQRICKKFTEYAPNAVNKCLNWAKNANQKFKFIPPASLWQTSGRSFGNSIRRGIKETPSINIFEDTICVDLLKNKDVVCGAIAVDIYSGEVIKFISKSVIMATGGYQPYSLKNSISDMTGDGIAMSLRAGAKVSDMEFLLFIPTAIKPDYIKGSIIPYLMTIPVYFPLPFKVRTMDGELIEIDKKYKTIPATSKMNKIIYSYVYGKKVFESYEKYGNSFYYDFSEYSDDELRQGFKGMTERIGTWHRKDFYNGVDLNDLCDYIINNGKKLEVGFGNEYSMGGVVVDDKLSTDVKGLFAAGEVKAGLFGAFRSADGLTEMLADGVLAAYSALEYAEGTDLFEPDNVDEILEELEKPLLSKDGAHPYHVIKDIESNNDYGFNFFRTEERLNHSKDVIKDIKNRTLATVHKGREYNYEWISSIIARNLALLSEIGITAAQLRKESRGSHMRYDYPVVDNKNFIKNIVFNLKDNDIKYEFKDPVIIDREPPKESFDNILDYILWSM